MNAVGKLGTFISKGVYTVSGPFHPFGGAVDIVVVQQEDGSFKSSPWYVRFGKFQGVLKSKENVVTISVNGVEAGFNMFLDHTGQTFFLRDLEDGEDQYFLSLSTSGDETEVMAKEERFKKRHSFDVGVVQREQETRVDQENGDILTATSSRRSTIFGFAFGRKSTKESDTGENLGRVSSMERAEIAADLLEKKWSTNVKSSGPSADLPEVETSTSSAMKVSDAHEERLEKPSPNEGLQSDEHPICNEKTDDNYGTGSSSRNCLEQEKIDDPSYLNVSKETKEISTTTNSDKTNSKTVVRTRNYDVDPQIYNFDTDETGLGNTQVKNYLNKKNLDEVASNEVAVQIYTVETGDSFHRNELNSELVTVQSNKTDVRNPDSTAFDEASQPHSSTLIGTTAGMPTCVNGEEEMSTFGDSGAIAHSTGMSNISDEKNSERLSLPSGDIEHCKNEFLSNLSCTIPEVTFVSETIAPLGKKKSNGSCAQNLESRSEEYFVSEESQYGFARHGAFGNSDNKGINTDTNADSISEQFSCVFPHLSNQELLNSDHEFTSTGAITKEFSDLGNRDAFRIPYFPVSLSSDTLNSIAATGSYSVSDIPNSFNSINAAQNIKVVEGDVNLKRSYSPAEANAAQDICIISTQTEANKFSASCSKNIDDVQFPFSDIDSDNFDSKEIETRQSNDGKTADMPIQAAQRDTGELDLGFKKNELTPRETSDDLRNHYVPINTSDPKTSYGETELFSRSLPIIRSHINNLEGYDFHHSMSCSLNSLADIRGLDVLKNENFILSWLAEPQTEVIETGTSIVANTDVVDNEQKQKDNTTNASVDGADTDNDASRSIMPSGGSWNLWPFLKRSKTVSNTLTTSETTKEMDVDPPSISTRSMTFDSSMKKDNNLKVQSLTPTTEELSTLNLKEGQNLVKFSFSTSMLGSQQVDARIYLWKWNTRIVISDVDGTITRSDVLGQFMPLVGIDWSQTGVTHLFSAIKDNGYQLLFLSARSISQAHITRQFLSNLKQDGKALPEGPVLISPDGLFPSLYREVIRRAPHEFKISCLEDIKALFPPDYNPFYAGFGNRDTDTISYLKVGIPMGKIFIIDPKGQIVVNRQVDTRSYASLHDLVNEIFPSMSSFEQEDYNSWNYWKLPVREVIF